MNCRVPSAPTGQNVIAQGNALALPRHPCLALKGRNPDGACPAQSVPPIQGGIFRHHGSRGDAPGYPIVPRWGGISFHARSHGVAMGYPIAPRWGDDSTR
jgi:hypothetical protein